MFEYHVFGYPRKMKSTKKKKNHSIQSKNDIFDAKYFPNLSHLWFFLSLSPSGVK